MNKKREDGWFTILPPAGPVNPTPGSEKWKWFDISTLEPITNLTPVGDDPVPGVIRPVEEPKKS
jgi:hypothetical protein